MAAENASENPVGLLLDAINFSAIKHSTQRRKDAEKTPYINHPIGVAHILWKEGDVTDLATLQVTMTIETGRGLNIARLGFSLVSSVLKDIYIYIYIYMGWSRIYLRTLIHSLSLPFQSAAVCV